MFLHTDIFDSFLAKLKTKADALKIGDPLLEETDMGSIINKKQFTKVCGYVEDGLKRKAEPAPFDPSFREQQVEYRFDRKGRDDQNAPARSQGRDAEKTAARVEHRPPLLPGRDADVQRDAPIDPAPRAAVP